MRSQHGGRQVPPIPGLGERVRPGVLRGLAEVLDRGRLMTWSAVGGRRLAIAFMRFRCVRACRAAARRPPTASSEGSQPAACSKATAIAR
jgi:hypothetical protein